MLVKEYLVEIDRRKHAEREAAKRPPSSSPSSSDNTELETDSIDSNSDSSPPTTTIEDHPSYIDTERAESADSDNNGDAESLPEYTNERLVDVVLSDMSAPWTQTAGFSSRTLSNPYDRMMNTSGMSFRDHAGSMVCKTPLSPLSNAISSKPLRSSRVRTYSLTISSHPCVNRISATPPSNSPATPSVVTDTLSANSTKAQRTNCSRPNSRRCLAKSTGRSPIRHELSTLR